MRLAAALVCCALSMSPSAARAQQGPATGEAVKPKKAKKDDQTAGKKDKKGKKAKKSKKDTPAPDETIDPQTDAASKGARLAWKQHPSFRVGSWFRMDYDMKIQEDGRAAYEGIRSCTDATPTNCFVPWEMHRSRVGISGYATKKIEYEVEYELREKELTEKDIKNGVTPKSQWKDANLNFTYFNNAQVRVGKFKIPFSLDELTGITHNDFIFRSLGATYLAPAHDIGVMVHGRFFKRGLNYWAGGFRHDGDNAQSKKIRGGDETLAGRLTGAPLRAAGETLGNLQVGTSFTISKLSDDSFRPNGLRGRTILTQDYFWEPLYVKGNRRRWGVDGDWSAGPVSARAEYTLQLDTRNGQGLGGEDLPDARARAWYASATWLLTGESKKRPVAPDNDFLQGGFGAIELAARVERIWFDSLGSGAVYRSPRAEFVQPEGDRAVTLGLNWTLNRFTKVQFNAIREQLENRTLNAALPEGFPAGAFWSRLVRFQLVI